MTKENIKDIVVIGSGPAGMTGALYGGRANLNVLVIEKALYGGQMQSTLEIENYIGSGLVTGEELSDRMYTDMKSNGVEYKMGEVVEIKEDGALKVVRLASGEEIKAKSIIIATGTSHKKLGVPGEERLSGRGVSYCAVCDGAFFFGKQVYVVGGGDSAVEEAMFLTNYAEKVTVVHRRDTLRAQPILANRAFNNEKIDFLWDSIVTEIKGEDSVKSLEIQNLKTGEFSEVPADGIFIYVGLVPHTEFLQSTDLLNEEGWIPTNSKMETTSKGIYAVGDVRDTPLRQILTATGDGCIAGQECYNYVSSMD